VLGGQALILSVHSAATAAPAPKGLFLPILAPRNPQEPPGSCLFLRAMSQGRFQLHIAKEEIEPAKQSGHLTRRRL
jgi:hypothetical protein